MSISSFFFFRMYSFASCTCLFPLFSLFACVYLPLAHTYFFFFLFSHVFPCFWHMPISSFFSFRMYSLTSGTYLFLLFSFFACIPLPLAHAYFLFFLFSHVFLCLLHMPISSFFSFRMYSLTSGTYLFLFFSLFACISLLLAHTYFFFFLFSHVFPCLWHMPISSFFSFRMCLLAAGTYLIHNFPLSRMYFIHYCSYPFYACIISTNQPQKNNVIIQIIEINILKYPTQSCVIKWLKEKLMFELLF